MPQAMDDQDRFDEAKRLGPQTEEQEKELEKALELGRMVNELERTDGWKLVVLPNLQTLFEHAFRELKACNSKDAIDYARPQERMNVVNKVLDELSMLKAAHSEAAIHFNRRK